MITEPMSPYAGDLSRSYYNEGRNLMEKGDLDSAIESFAKSLDFRIHFKTLELLGECHLRKGHFEKAILYLASAVTLNKGVRAASLLATAMFESGENAHRLDAREFIDLALARDPKNRTALELKRKLESTSYDAT